MLSHARQSALPSGSSLWRYLAGSCQDVPLPYPSILSLCHMGIE